MKSIRMIRRHFCLASLLAAGMFAIDARALPSQGRIFDNPNEAARKLVEAAEMRDRTQLAGIFGAGGDEVISSGDRVADDAALERFASLARAAMRIEPAKDGSQILVLGESEWPFPIPLVKEMQGWRFDTMRGKDEILTRRIGRNELNAMDAARAYVDAQREYHRRAVDNGMSPQYAQVFVSEAGKRNGLFWARKPGEAPSPLGPLLVRGTSEGYRPEPGRKESKPFHGYRFRILAGQGPAAEGGKKSYLNDKGELTEGFGLLAFPEKWGASGIMSFMINHDGRLFERNLGPDTGRIAGSIVSFNPERDWLEVK